MGKQPSFQFYPGDWRKDPAIQRACMTTRGVWWELVCCMWENDERGSISGTLQQLCRILGATEEELKIALEEIRSLKIGDVQLSEEGVYKISNRRMVREEAERQSGRARQEKFRSKKGENITPISREYNADITPISHDSSSSSSSSSSDIDSSCSLEQLGGKPPGGSSLPPTNKGLITELVDKYRAQPNISPQQGDYPVIGRIYNQYGYDEVLLAIERLGDKTSIEPIREPLKYLIGILNGGGTDSKRSGQKGKKNGRKPVDWENEPWSL